MWWIGRCSSCFFNSSPQSGSTCRNDDFRSLDCWCLLRAHVILTCCVVIAGSSWMSRWEQVHFHLSRYGFDAQRRRNKLPGRCSTVKVSEIIVKVVTVCYPNRKTVFITEVRISVIIMLWRRSTFPLLYQTPVSRSRFRRVYNIIM